MLPTDWGYTEVEWESKSDPQSYTETQIEWTYTGPKNSGYMKIEMESIRPNGSSYTEVEWTYMDKNGNGSTSVKGLPAAIQFLEKGGQPYMKIEMEK